MLNQESRPEIHRSPSEHSARVNKVNLLHYKENKEKGKHNTTPLIWVSGWFTAWAGCIRGFFDSVQQMFAPTLSHRGSIIILHPWFGGKGYDRFRFLGKGSRLGWGSLVLLGRDVWPVKGKNSLRFTFFSAVEGLSANILSHSCGCTQEWCL